MRIPALFNELLISQSIAVSVMGSEREKKKTISHYYGGASSQRLL